MFEDYEGRKVGRHGVKGKLIVSTAGVSDSDNPFETAISERGYNGGAWVIVEEYANRADAVKGHKKWVETMTADTLPDELVDISSAGIAKLAGHRTYKRQEV